MLDRARSALARGDDASALLALQEHEQLFPAGRLREEREATLIQVLVLRGELAEARQRAAAFRTMHPRSMLLPAVETALTAADGGASSQ